MREEDFKLALTGIFENRVEGWWNYERQLEELGICSHAEFLKAMDQEP